MIPKHAFLFVDEFNDGDVQCTDLITGETLELSMNDVEENYTAFSNYLAQLQIEERVILVLDTMLD